MRYNFVKKTLAVTLAAVLTAGILTGCGSSKIDGTKTVATCNDTKIPLGVASLMARYEQAAMYTQYSAYFGSSIWSTVTDEESGETYGESTKKNIMDTLEELYLLQEHISDYDVTMTDADKTAISEAAAQFMSDNDEATIEKIGCSQADVEQYLTLSTIRTRMYDAMTADVDTEVSDDEAAQKTITYVSVSTAGTKTGDDGNTVDLTDEEKAAQKEKAQSILDQVKTEADVANADMSAIAQSADSNLSASQASYGTDDKNLDDALKKAADTLQDGQVYDSVIDGENACYVVRMDSTFDESATESKKQSIVTERKQTAYSDLVDGWKTDASFVVEDKVWDKVSLTDTDVYQIFVPTAAPTPTDGTTSTDDAAEAATPTGAEEQGVG